MNALTTAPLALCLALLCPQDNAQLHVQPDKENVVASGLIGTWIPDEAIGNRLGTQTKATLSFEEDRSVLSKIPSELAEFIAKKQIYLAGYMTWREEGKDAPKSVFALIDLHGNPHLVQYVSKRGEKIDDAESCNIMLGKARDSANDILLVGADFNNEPFRAFKRKSQ